MDERSKYFILDADGEPQPVDDVLVWAEWFERASRDRSRIVAQDRDERAAAPSTMVSTVFLGLDHAFGGGTPLLYETMILGGVHDGYQRRTTTRAAALEAHRIACALMKVE